MLRTATSMLLRRVAAQPALSPCAVAVRGLSDAAVATAAATRVKLNFTLPHETIYHGADIASIILPGTEGEYGVAPNHVPYVAQLAPGVVQILHEEGSSDPEKYFIAGGYAITHADSTTVSWCNDFRQMAD
jgi:ATP synthase, Delta/Epsilon chain, beta-sandwich domain